MNGTAAGGGVAGKYVAFASVSSSFPVTFRWFAMVSRMDGRRLGAARCGRVITAAAGR